MHKLKLRDLWLPLLAACIVGLLLWPWSLQFLGTVMHELFILIVASAIGFLVSLAAIWPEVGILLWQRSETHRRLRKPFGMFSRIYLTRLDVFRRGLTSPSGYELASEDLEKFVAACFKANGGNRYIGTDSNVPSQFRRIYPNYLDEHFKPPMPRARSRDVRILIVSQSDLEGDYAANKSEFVMFYKGHGRNSAALLLQVERSVAEVAQKIQRFPSTDIGIFGSDFVVFFKPDGGQGEKSRCRVLVEPLNPERAKQLCEYLRRLNACAKEIRLVNDILKCEDRNKEHLAIDEESLIGNLKGAT